MLGFSTLHECRIPVRDEPFMSVLQVSVQSCCEFSSDTVTASAATLCGPAARGGLELTLVLPGVPALADSLRAKSEG